RKRVYALQYADEPEFGMIPKLFMIEGFLGRDECSCWFGQPESGKSTIIIDAACHVAAGRDYYGRKIMHGAVLYVAAERGKNVKRRIRAWLKKHGVNKIPLAAIDDVCDLRTGQVDTEAIIAAAQEVAKARGVPVIWIIFDTLSRVLAGGDENSSKDM